MHRIEFTSQAALMLAILTTVACGQDPKFSGTPPTADYGSSDATGADQEDHQAPPAVEGHPTIPAPNRPSAGPKSPITPPEGTIIVEESKKIVGIDLTREFISGRKDKAKMEFTLSNSSLSEEFIFKHEELITKDEKRFEQITKPPVMETYKQGTKGAQTTETFEQTQTGILDILVVIDNSGSMDEEQVNLSTKLTSLLSKVKDSAWQVGVVTTDPKDPCLRTLIKKGDADAESLFAEAVTAGVKGASSERPVLTSAIGLGLSVDWNRDGSLDQCATSWVRDNSSLAILIVSDEDNCSYVSSTTGKNDCGEEPWGRHTFLTDHLGKIRTIAADRNAAVNGRIYGLFAIPGVKCTTANHTGYDLNRLVKATGGVAGSICDADYSSALTAISTDFATILKSQFSLQHTPDLATLKVYIDGTLVDGGYKISGTTLTFDHTPPAGAKIVVDYGYGATQISTEFALAAEPAPNSVVAIVNGLQISSSEFTVLTNEKKVKFHVPPADGAEIRLLYRKEISLPNTVEISKNAIPSSVAAKVNGVDATIVDYVPESGVITFAEPPSEGSTIVVTFEMREKGDPIVQFPFSTPWQRVKDLSARDKNSGVQIDVEWKKDTLSFDLNAFSDGRIVVITYRDESAGPGRKFSLANFPIAGRVDIQGFDPNDALISCDHSQIIVRGKEVETSCDLGDAEKVFLDYQYETGMRASFVMSEVTNPQEYRWSVYVNGVVTLDYIRTGNKIEFPAALPGGTIIKVVAKYTND